MTGMTHREPGEPPYTAKDRRLVESQSVGLPEFLRKETAEGLLPQTIAYFAPSTLTYDVYTDKIWFDTDTQVREGTLTLESYTHSKHNYIAVMPLLAEDGTRHYIVDATGLQSGQLDIEQDWLGYKDEADDHELSDYCKNKRKTHATITAAAFTNLEGEIEFHGVSEYFAALDYLVTAYDEQVALNISSSTFPYPIHEVEAVDDPSEEDASPEETLADGVEVEIIYHLPDDPMYS